MAYRGDTVRDEPFSGSGAFSSASGFFRVAGGWGNIVGPSLFMTRVIFSGSVAAVYMGLAGAVITGVLTGFHALGFMVASCAGFILGVSSFYRASFQAARRALYRYPRILQLHLDANFPHEGFLLRPVEKLRHEQFDMLTVKGSHLVTAWLSAQPALDKLIDYEEQKAVDEATTGMEQQGSDT